MPRLHEADATPRTPASSTGHIGEHSSLAGLTSLASAKVHVFQDACCKGGTLDSQLLIVDSRHTSCIAWSTWTVFRRAPCDTRGQHGVGRVDLSARNEAKMHLIKAEDFSDRNALHVWYRGLSDACPSPGSVSCCAFPAAGPPSQ